ncbi:outer membrane beta-barrel protein [Cognaticolwellia mytili]|uniref:outer membrane beta-barrel protein n=1 Tax=Cognaticolwellia mytili TaxID=1888913 RepID=UPI001301F0FE|nr:outer membrane beta-barrel protein [Cognaticolwellia mytili]
MVFKKFLFALPLLTLPLTVSANWSTGAGYLSFSDEEDGTELSLAAMYGSLAYEFYLEDSSLSLVPELRIGTGISDDDVKIDFGPLNGTINVEMKSFYSFSVRAQYNYDNGVYLYVVPSYASVDLEFSAFGESASDDDGEVGFGGGFGKKINDNTSVQLSYEIYDEIEVFTVGFNYQF